MHLIPLNSRVSDTRFKKLILFFNESSKTTSILSLIIILSVAISVFGYVFSEPLLYLFGATKTILPYAMQYMHVIFFGTVFFAFGSASNNIIRSEGNAGYAMIMMMIGAGANIILDPIFIFILDLGMRGAALATVASQSLAALGAIYYFTSKKSSLRIYFKNLKLKIEIIK